VTGLLRFLAIVNAATWFGATAFLTLVVGPAFFSAPMLAVLGRPHAGAAAQIILERYFILHLVCGSIALLLLLADWFLRGRRPTRMRIALIGTLLLLIGVGGFIIQPKLQTLFRVRYDPAASAVVRQQATDTFKTWHAVSQAMNLVVLLGVFGYLVQVTHNNENIRFRP
jgi:preprotein translocase subunit Sss1